MNDSIPNLHERIRKCAEMAGSGHALADKTGIPRRTLETYLSGNAEPKASRVLSIAKAAGVSLEWLLTGNGPIRRSPVGCHANIDLHIDIALLEEVLNTIEAALKQSGRVLSSDKKARFIAVVYDLHHESSNAPCKEHIARLLQLID